MRTFSRLLAFGSSRLVRFFFRTMKMMILMMMSILLTENTTAKEKKKKRRKRSSYFLTNTHTHTHTSLSLCVCVCVGFSLKTLSLCVTAVRALYFIEHLTRNERKIFSPRKRKERKTCTRIRVEDPNNKNRQKSLWTKMHRRATRRDRLV